MEFKQGKEGNEILGILGEEQVKCDKMNRLKQGLCTLVQLGHCTEVLWLKRVKGD